METQINLMMVYFEVFQEVIETDTFYSDNRQLAPILDDLKCGPILFYDKYKGQI